VEVAVVEDVVAVASMAYRAVAPAVDAGIAVVEDVVEPVEVVAADRAYYVAAVVVGDERMRTARLRT
jgi:hypothetical protein